MNMVRDERAGLRLRDLDAGLGFNGRKSGTVIKGHAQTTTCTPAVDPGSSFPETSAMWWSGSPTRKSRSMASAPQAAARPRASNSWRGTQIHVFGVTGHRRLECSGLAGHPGVGAGTMVFECGTITPAMRYGRLSASRASTSSLARTAGIVRVREGQRE